MNLTAISNHLWQSTMFAVAAGLLTLSLRKQRARVRHAVWLAASLKFLIPFFMAGRDWQSPGVVTLILPVFAPNGTVAVIRVYESTLKLVALTPPKVTVVAPVKLSPLMMTLVSTGPLVGEKLAIVGITRKGTSLKSIPPGVVTLTLPVVAPAGTIVVISVFETILNVFAVV